MGSEVRPTPFWAVKKGKDDFWDEEKVFNELVSPRARGPFSSLLRRFTREFPESFETALKIGTYFGRRNLYHGRNFSVGANAIRLSNKFFDELGMACFPCFMRVHTTLTEREAGAVSSKIACINWTKDNIHFVGVWGPVKLFSGQKSYYDSRFNCLGWMTKGCDKK